MSKAFTKEQDSDNDDDLELPQAQIPGGKNYITPGGHERLRSELNELLTKTRPHITEVVAWAASLGDRSENADYIENKRRLREIDRRIRFLTKRLEIAEIVDPTQNQTETIHFGATVTLRYENGESKTFAIVGIDETEVKAGRISWISPLGRALLKAKLGDTITFNSPKGEEDLEVLKVEYLPLP